MFRVDRWLSVLVLDGRYGQASAETALEEDPSRMSHPATLFSGRRERGEERREVLSLVYTYGHEVSAIVRSQYCCGGDAQSLSASALIALCADLCMKNRHFI